MRLVSDALLALDAFDLPRRSSDVKQQKRQLVPSCFEAAWVEPWGAVSIPALRDPTFVAGPEFFPEPRQPTERAVWTHLLGGFADGRRPRVALGKGVTTLLANVRANRDDPSQWPTLDASDRAHVASGLDSYMVMARTAAQSGHAVVEWIGASVVDDEDDDDRATLSWGLDSGDERSRRH
jgi:hypothetical protein